MIDERTGRPIGDHGTAAQAIEYALDLSDTDPGNQVAFLRAWREGAAADEWSDFYDWLRGQEVTDGPFAIGRTILTGKEA